MRPTRAIINLKAITENAKKLAELQPQTKLCGIIKADGYGHGTLPAAKALISAGIEWLGVALVEEGVELRQGKITNPILLLSEPRPAEMVEVVEYDLRPTLYSSSALAAVCAAVDLHPEKAPLPVHLKVDTGMHRVGAAPEEMLSLAKAVMDKKNIHLEGIWSHLAVADELQNPQNQRQAELFEKVLAELSAQGVSWDYSHLVNSAGYLNFPEYRYDIARVGIALYGILPSAPTTSISTTPTSTSTPSTTITSSSAPTPTPTSTSTPATTPTPTPSSQLPLKLEPAIRLVSEVSLVKQVCAGEGISYGLQHTLSQPAQIATIPIGYADGIRRDYGMRGGEVLIGGKRHPIVGTVTMDQLMVQCMDENISAGSEVVLIGTQGEEEITAEEVAHKLGTIAYEVVCDIGKRVRREYG